jgi:hypothetical protein
LTNWSKRKPLGEDPVFTKGIDALLIQLCLSNDLTRLTTDQNFQAAAKHHAFSLWGASDAESGHSVCSPQDV